MVGPDLTSAPLMSQFWADISFIHWRVDPRLLTSFMPPGARPDIHDGSAWVGLLPFQMQRAGIGSGPAVPWWGTFWETNVRVYSTDDHGRPGVVFLSLEAQRLAVVVGARLTFGVPYFWARMSGRRSVSAVRYQSRRYGLNGGRRRSVIEVRVGAPIRRPTQTHVFLSARFGLHTSVAGRGLWVPNTHRPWPLREAQVVHLEDQLISAAGLPDLAALRPPDHVMFSAGVHTHFGMPQRTL